MLCRIVRWLVDRHIDGRPMPDWADRHVSRCPQCRQHQAAGQELIAELRLAGLHDMPASHALRSRMLAAIGAEPVDAGGVARQPVIRRARLIGLAAAAVLALAAIPAARLLLPGDGSVAPPSPPLLAESAPLRVPPIEPAAALHRSASTIERLAQDAFMLELAAIYSDAQAASQVLLASLPVDVLLAGDGVTIQSANEN